MANRQIYTPHTALWQCIEIPLGVLNVDKSPLSFTLLCLQCYYPRYVEKPRFELVS